MGSSVIKIAWLCACVLALGWGTAAAVVPANDDCLHAQVVHETNLVFFGISSDSTSYVF